MIPSVTEMVARMVTRGWSVQFSPGVNGMDAQAWRTHPSYDDVVLGGFTCVLDAARALYKGTKEQRP